MASPPNNALTLSPRDSRRNFACLVWVGSVFSMGWAEVIAAQQPLLVHYGASNQQIGWLQSVLIGTVPGMFLSPWITRRFRYKKWYLFFANTLYLLPLGLVGAAVWAGGVGDSEFMVLFVLGMMFLGQIAAGFGGLPNQEFFTACIPMRLRGRLAGVTSGLGGALGLAGGAVAAWVLGCMPVPVGYGMLLVLAWFLCQTADSGVLFAKELPSPVEASPSPWGIAMWQAFLDDGKFLRVTVAACLLSPLLAQLALFPTVFAFRDLGFQPQMAAWLTITAAAARLLLCPPGGWLTDVWGARPAMLGWSALALVGFVLLALLPTSLSVFIAAGAAVVAYSGFSGALNALTSGIPRAEHRAGHFTLLAFCMVAANSAVPLITGWMFDKVSYRIGFSILAAATLAAIAVSAWLIRDFSTKAEEYQ